MAKKIEIRLKKKTTRTQIFRYYPYKSLNNNKTHPSVYRTPWQKTDTTEINWNANLIISNR